MELIKPKEIIITDIDGIERTYIISRMDFMSAREIGIQYPMTALPKVGDPKANKELSKKLLSFVAVKTGEIQQRLSTEELINNHIPDFVTGMKIEKAMLGYNISFFQDGTASDFLLDVVQIIRQKVSEILTPSPELSSVQEKQRYTN